MRITIAQGAFFPVPPLRGGAIEKAWFALGKEFVKRGHQVTHISRCFEGLPHVGLIEGVRHVRVAGYDQPSSIWMLKLCDLLYSIRAISALPEADILVTNTFWLPALIRNSKHGAVYVHVGRYPHGQIPLYAHAARLQTVSQVVAGAIKSQCSSVADKVRVVPYPLPEDMLVATETPPILDQRERCILYAGRLHPEKGVHLLINGFAQFLSRGAPGWKLVLLGPWQSELGGGGPDYLKRLQVCSKSISNHVEFAGMVKESSKLRQYYRRARLFVYPSLAEKGESFGLAPLEAMANGCPPLVSSLDCFKEFVTDGQTGFYFDHRRKDAVQALAEKLAEVINSPERLSAVATAAFGSAQDFSVGKVAERFLADFESLVKTESPC